MDGLFETRLRAAAAAGWWTLLVAVCFLQASWWGFLALMHFASDWVMTMVGGGEDLTEADIMIVSLGIFGAMKVVLLVLLLANVFLTLWSRKLRRMS